MTTGIYTTTDPNVRIRVIQDTEKPFDVPDFPWAEGVLEDLLKCYESGDYYGVEVHHRTVTQTKRINQATEEYTLDEEEDWDIADAIWSCAGYGEDIAKNVAKEFFDIEVTGKVE